MLQIPPDPVKEAQRHNSITKYKIKHPVKQASYYVALSFIALMPVESLAFINVYELIYHKSLDWFNPLSVWKMNWNLILNNTD